MLFDLKKKKLIHKEKNWWTNQISKWFNQKKVFAIRIQGKVFSEKNRMHHDHDCQSIKIVKHHLVHHRHGKVYDWITVHHPWLNSIRMQWIQAPHCIEVRVQWAHFDQEVAHLAFFHIQVYTFLFWNFISNWVFFFVYRK